MEDRPYKSYRAGRGRRRRGDDELFAGDPGARRAPAAKRSGAPRGARDGRDAQPAARERPVRERWPASNGRAPAPVRTPADNRGNGSDVPARRYAAGEAGARRAQSDVVPRRRRRFRWWYVPLALLLILAILFGAALIWAVPKYDAFAKAVTGANQRLPRSARAQLTPDAGSILSHPTTILVLGVDRKHRRDPARSDTIMLVRIDPRTHTISQLSIPRDTRVLVAGHGYGKINAAHFWGGPALAIKTIHQFTGVAINHVMVVDFMGFPKLVDAVGGVDMYVPKTVYTIGTGANPILIKKGRHHFDGATALRYVRVRKIDNDFYRMARQQAFMQALEKKLVRRSNVSRIGQISSLFMAGVATDLNAHQLLELAYLKWRTPAKNMSKAVMVGPTPIVGGQSYVVIDPASVRAYVSRFLKH